MQSRSVCFSPEQWKKIGQACGNNITHSSFIRMAVLKELRRRGIGE